jgi:hypothetical protein
MIFRRKIYDKMLQWKQQRKGHTALLIKGVQRVGDRILPYTKEMGIEINSKNPMK